MILAAIYAVNCFIPTCCQAMALLTNEPSFRKLHEVPIQVEFVPKFGHMMAIAGANDFVVPASKSNHAAVIVFHEWWGLNNQIKMTAEKLHDDTGDAVVAIDLYGGKVASTADEAGQFVRSVDEASTRRLIASTIDAIRQGATGSKISRIGTLGYCFGGGWSLQTALDGGSGIQACVMFYGHPEEDKARLDALRAPLLGFFGSQDKGITPALVSQFDRDLKAEDKRHWIYSYDAPHAFANPSNPHFNKEATEDSWKKAIAFYRRYLKS